MSGDKKSQASPAHTAVVVADTLLGRVFKVYMSVYTYISFALFVCFVSFLHCHVTNSGLFVVVH